MLWQPALSWKLQERASRSLLGTASGVSILALSTWRHHTWPRSPRPSPSVFAYYKLSRMGVGNGLRMRILACSHSYIPTLQHEEFPHICTAVHWPLNFTHAPCRAATTATNWQSQSQQAWSYCMIPFMCTFPKIGRKVKAHLQHRISEHCTFPANTFHWAPTCPKRQLYTHIPWCATLGLYLAIPIGIVGGGVGT